jgi:hypothetical protein
LEKIIQNGVFSKLGFEKQLFNSETLPSVIEMHAAQDEIIITH